MFLSAAVGRKDSTVKTLVIEYKKRKDENYLWECLDHVVNCYTKACYGVENIYFTIEPCATT